VRAIALLCVALVACASVPSPDERKDLADALAARRGWQARTIRAGGFALAAYLSETPRRSASLTIYIEGDGLAWLARSQPSSDPTPGDPVGLRLALAHPHGQAAYLARPCQYVVAEATACDSRYWMQARFAPDVIHAMNQAIDALAQRIGASELTLVGYSGGGAVAALVAARRSDVVRLLTVAGNLDHAAWTKHHAVSPLFDSLNPVDEVAALKSIPQWHAVGSEDTNTTPALLRAYADHFPPSQRPAIHIEPGFDHHCCWAERWPELWRNALSRTSPTR
jgi:dienelactone hydrolase